MIAPIVLQNRLDSGRTPPTPYLHIEWSAEKVQTVEDVQEAKKQLEEAVRALVLNFQKRTGLPVISIHAHEAKDPATAPFWKATVKL